MHKLVKAPTDALSTDELSNTSRFLSSGSSVVQSPALPWEVIERVIDLCSNDKTALRGVALTCIQLYPRSRFVLFTNVKLRSANQLMKFYDAVQAQPHLQPVVQSLSFPWGIVPSPQLLSILPGLHHVTFNKISSAIGQLPQSALHSGLRSLTIRDARFQSPAAFFRFLSAFPSVEILTCERLLMDAHTPLAPGDLSHQLQLRTLNILRDVDAHITEVLVHIISSPLAKTIYTQPSSMPPPESSGDCQTSLAWWIPAETDKIQYVTQFLGGSKQTAIRDITLVLWDASIGGLYSNCRRPANLDLCATLENVLLGYPFHRVRLTVPGGSILNARKAISWSDEFRRLFRPLSEKWALTEDIRYSGKPGHDSPATTLVVSPDGRLVATASTDSTIILWDARDACISQEWFTRHGEVWCLAFSPDGRRLASAGEDGKVAIWDISGSSHQVAVLEGHPATVFGCAWSSDGAYITSREGSGATRVWDGRTCRPRLFDGANYKYTNVEPLFSPDGRWLLAHNWSGCGVWDVGSGAHLALQFNDDGDHGASAAAFSPENAYVAVGYNSGTIRIWDMATRQAHLHLNAHTYRIHDVAFSPDGRLLLSVSNDKTVKIWDAHTGAMVQSLEGHEKLVWKACFSPCGKYVGSASGDKTVRVWRTSDGSCLATLPDHGDKVRHVAFTSDGTMLWSAADNGTVLGRRLQELIPDQFEV